MRKYLIVVFILIIVKTAKSDQLAWITLEQAEKTVEHFEDKEINRVIFWCACCDNDPKTIIKVTDVYYKKVQGYDYYEVWIKGKTTSGKKVNEAVDLAYVHIKRGGLWRCLGLELKFECDPCTKDFKL
jgi:hypothetical protein